MNKMAAVFVLALAADCSSAATSRAQAFSPFAFSYEVLPYENLINPPGGTFLEVAKIQAQKLQASLTFPLKFAREEGLFIGTGVVYERIDLDYEYWNQAAVWPVRIGTLHSVGLPVSLRGRLGENWSLRGYVVPSLESDFESHISRNDFSVQGEFVVQRSYGRGLTLGIGGLYTRDLGRPFPLPAIAIEWRRGRWSASGLLPVRSQINYDVMQELSFGGNFRISGSQYHGDPEIYGVAEPEIRYRDITLGGIVTLNAGGGSRLELESGLAFSRRSRLYDNGTLVSNLDLKDTMYTRIGIRLGGIGGGRGGGRGRGRG
ncbi:MAG: DUF6268 family outer membrane beta-barrel protein [Candidatus Glassbacteria bacterium]